MTPIAKVKPLILHRSKITRFNEAAHEYTKEKTNIVFPGVTSILNAAGFGDWMRNVDPADLDYARDRGTAIHRACQWHDDGSLDWSSVGEAIKPYVDAYAEWRVQSKFKTRWSELPMIHPTLGFAGTADLIGDMDGELAIGDLKSSASLNSSVALQLAGYADLIDAVPMIRVRRFALQLKSNGKARMHEYSVTDLLTRDFPAWRACLTLWRYRNDVRTSTSRNAAA